MRALPLKKVQIGSLVNPAESVYGVTDPHSDPCNSEGLHERLRRQHYLVIRHSGNRCN
jgi:hypothetical protein